MEGIKVNNNETRLEKKCTDAKVYFLSEIRQKFLDLAHYLGFKGLNECDMLDLL